MRSVPVLLAIVPVIFAFYCTAIGSNRRNAIDREVLGRSGLVRLIDDQMCMLLGQRMLICSSIFK